MPRGEAEYYGRGLGADTGEVLEPRLRLVQRHLAEEREVVAAKLLLYLLEDRLDTGGLDTGEPAHPDRLLQLGDRGSGDLVQRAVPLPETLEGSLRVDVRGVLGEYRVDQFPGWVVPGPPLDRVILGAKVGHDVARPDLPLPSALGPGILLRHSETVLVSDVQAAFMGAP